ELAMNGAAAPAPPAPRRREELAGLLPEQRRVALARSVRAAVAHVLGMASPDAVPPRTGFFALGMDSLTSLELRGRLQSQLDCPLTPTAAFEHPTVDALVSHLETLLGPAGEVNDHGDLDGA